MGAAGYAFALCLVALAAAGAIGHGVALLAGVGCLAVFGLTDPPPVIQEGLAPARVGAAALSVALTPSCGPAAPGRRRSK